MLVQMMVPCLICVIREVDFVEDLGCFMLDGLHFNQMRRILPGSITAPKQEVSPTSNKLSCFLLLFLLHVNNFYEQ